MIRGSWYKSRIVLQMLVDERIGRPLRAEVEGEMASEEAAFNDAKQVMPRAR